MPTRIALPSRSRPSGLGATVRFQRVMTMADATDRIAFSTKTQWLPALAITAPATSGPMIREAFIAMPLSPIAAGSWLRVTSSGTMAENTGQRIARPMPFKNVRASSIGALIQSDRIATHSSSATTATQSWVKMK